VLNESRLFVNELHQGLCLPRPTPAATEGSGTLRSPPPHTQTDIHSCPGTLLFGGCLHGGNILTREGCPVHYQPCTCNSTATSLLSEACSLCWPSHVCRVIDLIRLSWQGYFLPLCLLSPGNPRGRLDTTHECRLCFERAPQVVLHQQPHTPTTTTTTTATCWRPN